MSYNMPTFDYMRSRGFVFDGARQWITSGNMRTLAMDAAMVTTPNTGVPVELTAYIDPKVVEILTAPRRAREIYKEEKKGSWTTPYAKWRVEEITGASAPYSDYNEGVASDVNQTWAKREQYLYQTLITYGDLEQALSAEARINLAASKQKAAATVLDIDANKFYLLGVDGKNIYGILNDPDLPDAITPIDVDGNLAWESKDTVDIYNDILKLFAELQSQSLGLIDESTELVLCISPTMNRFLGSATEHNISVRDMVNKFLPNLRVCTLPECTTDSGEKIFLFAPEVAGQETGFLGFGDKIVAGRIIPGVSSYKQKFVAGTYGGIITHHFAVASMTGIESE